MERYELVQAILSRIYLPPYIYFKRIASYDSQRMSMEAVFQLPLSGVTRYTVEEMSYVSSTERHSCVNQLAYGLTALLVHDSVASFGNISLDCFVKLSSGLQMWNIDEHFTHRIIIPRGQEFPIAMRICRARLKHGSLGVVKAEISESVSGHIEFAITFPPP